MESLSWLPHPYSLIDQASNAIISGLSQVAKNPNSPIASLKSHVTGMLNEVLHSDAQSVITILERYYEWVETFRRSYQWKTNERKVARLLGENCNYKDNDLLLDGTVKVDDTSGPIIFIEFSHLSDLRRTYPHPWTNTSAIWWYFTFWSIHNLPLPIFTSVPPLPWEEDKVMIHELTHFRNSLFLQYWHTTHFSNYQKSVHPLLQNEILAFLSTDSNKIESIISTLQHSKCYQFYRQIPNWSSEHTQLFVNEVILYVTLAKEIGMMRPETYLIDLALMPMREWKLYKRYLKHQKV